MFSNDELGMIWFALLMEQQEQKEGSDRWWRYERLIARIEKKVGCKKRPLLRIVKTDE
jgi:hypothetical protein